MWLGTTKPFNLVSLTFVNGKKLTRNRQKAALDFKMKRKNTRASDTWFPAKPKRKRAKAKKYEHAHQCAVIQWLRLQHPWLFDLTYAIPNGGGRSEIEAGCLKDEGVSPGVPDLCIAHARGKFHGLYIEMKRLEKESSNKPVISIEQEAWILRLRAENYAAYVCYGADEAIDTIKKYLRLPKL